MLYFFLIPQAVFCFVFSLLWKRAQEYAQESFIHAVTCRRLLAPVAPIDKSATITDGLFGLHMSPSVTLGSATQAGIMSCWDGRFVVEPGSQFNPLLLEIAASLWNH